jgi:hypothetical protein
MLNLTIASLQRAALLSPGPLFTSPSTLLRLHHSAFFRSAVPVFHLSSFSHLSLADTKFCQFLNGAIHISKEEFRKVTFNSTRNFSGESVDIARCLFLECVSPLPGGAISFNSDGEVGTINISNSGFANCSSELSGGAIFVSARLIALSRVCFANCTTYSGNATVIQSGVDESLVFEYVEFLEDSHESEYSVSCRLVSLESMWLYLNVTSPRTAVAFSVRSLQCKTTFLTAVGGTQVDLFQFTSSSMLMKSSDFVNNSFSGGVFRLGAGAAMWISTSVFLRLAGRIVDPRKDLASTCRLKECVFDVSEAELDSANITLRFCTVSAENVTVNAVVQLNTDFCWLGQATWDVSAVSFRLSGASIAFLLICIVIFTSFLIMKGKLEDPGGMNKASELRRKSSEWSDEKEEIKEIPLEGADDEGIALALDEPEKEDTPKEQKGRGGRGGRGGKRRGRGEGTYQ